jgi:hypothetical protein
MPSKRDVQQEFLELFEIEFGLNDEALDHYRQYEDNPIEFIETELGFSLTQQQKQICESVRDSRETNVQASHGVGKTMLSGCLVFWWILAVGGLCITTAPTARQVENLLWGEVRKTHGRKALPGNLGRTFLRLSEEAQAYGFTANDNNSNAFQGVHHPRLLVIEDEACGISNEIDEGASSCVTGAKNRFLRVGNPIESGGAFEKACKRSHIRIPVWEHPNVQWAYEKNSDGIHRLKPEVAAAIVGEDGRIKDPSEWPEWCPQDVIPGAVSVLWIEEARAKFGEGSAYWQSRVEGYFPEDSGASIVPRTWFLAARARYDENPEHWDNLAAKHESRHGLDVGDGGDDHAWARWRGPVLYNAEEYPTKGDRQDVSRATGIARKKLAEFGGTINVDRLGVGSGVLSNLLDEGMSCAFGIAWGEGAEDSAQFQNSKAEHFWELREAFRTGEIAIAPLGESEERVMEDLAGTYYEESSTGKIRIEDKTKKTRKRLHRSPNAGDAVCMAFKKPEIPYWGTSEASFGY